MWRTEGRHCTAGEEEALPGSGGALSLGRHDIVGEKRDCRGNAAALGCGCHGGVGAQPEGRGQGWRAELSSGRFGMFGGSRFLPRAGSSVLTGYRLGRST